MDKLLASLLQTFVLNLFGAKIEYSSSVAFVLPDAAAGLLAKNPSTQFVNMRPWWQSFEQLSMDCQASAAAATFQDLFLPCSKGMDCLPSD
eukprot:5409313-Amphidinium_carterae.1